MTLKQLLRKKNKWRRRLDRYYKQWYNNRNEKHTPTYTKIKKSFNYWLRRWNFAFFKSGWWEQDCGDSYYKYIRNGQHKKAWKRKHRNDVIVIFC